MWAIVRNWVSDVLTTAPSWMHWLMLALMAILIGLVAAFVDLTPHVDEDFFFSRRDPQFKQSQKINETFPAPSQLILNVESPDISSKSYLRDIRRLTKKIKAIDKVVGVSSLTDGPKNLADAMNSPLWRRLLIAHNRQSSNLLEFVEGKEA